MNFMKGFGRIPFFTLRYTRHVLYSNERFSHTKGAMIRVSYGIFKSQGRLVEREAVLHLFRVAGMMALSQSDRRPKFWLLMQFRANSAQCSLSFSHSISPSLLREEIHLMAVV